MQIGIPASEWRKSLALAAKQVKETVDQELKGVTIRMADITCACGRKRALIKSYQCLYCKIWFCDQCAEQHFGQTVEEYRADNPIIENA